jgi:hypothetical protein
MRSLAPPRRPAMPLPFKITLPETEGELID